MKRTWPVLAVFAIALLIACKRKNYDPKIGGHCPAEWWPKGMGVCADKSRFLFCNMMTFQAISCHGPKGCTGTEPGAFMDQCDISENAAGEVCPPPPSIMGDRTYRTCRTGGKELTVCTGGDPSRIEVLPCRGPSGCHSAASGLACDDSIARAGDVCDPVVYQAIYTCSEDKKTLLACRNAAGSAFSWQPARSCQGAKGCVRHATGPNADCDSTIATLGDPCERDGIPACSADKKSWLTCKAGKFVLEKACPGKNGCQFNWPDANNYKVVCDG